MPTARSGIDVSQPESSPLSCAFGILCRCSSSIATFFKLFLSRCFSHMLHALMPLPACEKLKRGQTRAPSSGRAITTFTITIQQRGLDRPPAKIAMTSAVLMEYRDTLPQSTKNDNMRDISCEPGWPTRTLMAHACMAAYFIRWCYARKTR